jgi:hypothetical protein
MKIQMQTPKNILNKFLTIILLISFLIPLSAGAEVLNPEQNIPSGQTTQFPFELPVFKLLPVEVNEDTAAQLAALFDGIGGGDVETNESHTGTPRYVVYKEETGAQLEQYGASGGFFAFNVENAFRETPAVLGYDARMICLFLARKQLFPEHTTPETRNCNSQEPLPYLNNFINLATITPMSGAQGIDQFLAGEVNSSVEIIGEIWQIPLAIDVGSELGVQQSIYVPMGGPGGHLSLLLIGFDQVTPPLDSALTGIQALALPSHGQQRSSIGLFKVIQPDIALDIAVELMANIFPGSEIFPGEPELIYYVDDPAEEQENMMPVWYFPEASAIVDGEEVNLRGFTIPAVEGFLPEVEITSPESGLRYIPGQTLDVTALVTGGEPPFDFTFELEDGTPINTGSTEDGVINFTTPALPAADKLDEGLFLTLVVTDNNSAMAFDTIELVTPYRMFIPASLRNADLSGQSMQAMDSDFISQSEISQTIRSFAVQWVRYYNGHGSDLPGTQPDGTGFRNKLVGKGWQQVVHYYNNNAWEKDWRDCSLGGIDCTFGVDRADFGYFAGHGSGARIYFGVNKDSYNFFAGNARYQRLRWIGFATCQTLRAGQFVGPGNPPLTHWFNSFQGSYMLLGFHSNMKDVAFGPRFVDNLAFFSAFGSLRSVREAWVLTAFQMNAGKPAYLYARSATFNPVNSRIPPHGIPIPPLNPAAITSFHWVWWE